MDVYQEILEVVLNAVKQLVLNRFEDSAFTDEEDVKNRKYFSTLEGLDSILIPAVNLPKNIFWEPLIELYPDLRNIIVDDINFIIGLNTDVHKPPSEHGAPYFSKGPTKRTPYWTAECSSFTLSVMTNYLALSEKKFLPKPKPPDSKILEVIRTNLKWVGRCRRNHEGWSWTPDTDAHPWPTWSLLDTFEELFRFRKYQNEYTYLKEQCDTVTLEIAKSFSASDKHSLLKQWADKVLTPMQQYGNYDVEIVFNLVRLILAASIYRTGHEVFPMAECLYAWAFKCNFQEREYKYHFEEMADYIYDSALLPYVFRALIVTAHKLKPRLIENLDTSLGVNHEVVINRIYSRLQSDLIKDNNHKYNGLWDVRGTSSPKYELYYTERTIEALTDYLVYYKQSKTTIIRPLQIASSPKPKAKKKKKKEKRKRVIKTPVRDVLSNDFNKYTLWIRELAKGIVPDDLKGNVGWKAEEMLEFYMFRLFNVLFFLDGSEWGYKKRGKALPDGRITLPDNNKHCLYDAKSSMNTYNLSKSEIRKFKDYTNTGKEWAKAAGKEVQYFLVIAPSFRGKLQDKAQEFYSETNTNLVCTEAEDFCHFTDKVREVSQNASAVRLIKWRKLLSIGKPLLLEEHFDKAFNDWSTDLGKLEDF